MSKKLTIAAAFVIVLAVSCKRQIEVPTFFPELPGQVYDYENAVGQNNTTKISSLIKDGSAKEFNNHTATLGRVLFYDKQLSINNTTSCGSCHIQKLAFSDGKAFSTGFSNGITPRSSMAILNPVENNNMFWDSRSKSPLELSLQPVFNHLEMGMESDEMLIKKVAAISYYPELFKNAFGSEEVTRERIAKAISHFVSSIFSKNSKFDEGTKDNFKNFTSLELMGKDLFFSSRLMCSSCHGGDNFVAPDAPGSPYGRSSSNVDAKGTANIGLDLIYKDNGRGEGKFKIPSLRNIQLTAPYMHDGRFNTLEEVIDHYSHGIKNHPALDPKFKENGSVKKLNITENEKFAIIAFLKTFTDYNLISDVKFSDPFVKR